MTTPAQEWDILKARLRDIVIDAFHAGMQAERVSFGKAAKQVEQLDRMDEVIEAIRKFELARIEEAKNGNGRKSA